MKTENLKTNKTKDNPRAMKFFREHQKKIYESTDRLFAVLMPIQWVLAIVLASVYSPLTWVGAESKIHPHIWTAIFVGGVITSLPVFLAVKYTGASVTRYCVAVSQLLMSSLLIHVTGGRIETHFHIYGSLAFLAFYRDWRVLIPATIVTAFDHIFRGWFYPQSIYGILINNEWRWIEHASWVIFEDVFLILLCQKNLKEMWESAIDTTVMDDSETRYRAVVEQMTEGIFVLEPKKFRVLESNEAFAKILGYKNADEVKSLSASAFDEANFEELEMMANGLKADEGSMKTQRKFRRKDGSFVYVEIMGRCISYGEGFAFCVNVIDITERKRAEGEIKRLALVAQKTKDSVIIHNSKNQIEWVNEAFTELSGYTFDEARGKNPEEILVGIETSRETLAEIQKCVNEQIPFSGEIYNYDKAGNGYWASLSLLPIHSKGGKLEGFIGVQSDITGRKVMEKALQAANEDLEIRIANRTGELLQTVEDLQKEFEERQRIEVQQTAILDALPAQLCLLDQSGNILDVNGSWKEFADKNNYSGTNYGIGSNYIELCENATGEWSEGSNQAAEICRSVLLGEVPFLEMEYPCHSPIEERWFKLSVARLHKEKLMGVVVIHTNITERKQSEQKVNESKNFLDRVINKVPNLIFVKDQESKYVLANAAFASMYGKTVSELIGKSDTELIANSEDIERYKISDKIVLENKEDFVNQEDKFIDSDGVMHWLQTVKRPLLGKSGVEFILGISTDLTERKSLESQLQHAQKLESIGQLAAGIAHEINTPTQYVGDNTKFLQEGFEAITSVLEKYNELLEAARNNQITPDLIAAVDNEINASDMEYFVEEVPKTVEQSIEGISRIAQIVQSMKDFAHPGTKDKSLVNLNKAIESTINVARNEWKYVADLETNFDANLPNVPCLLGEFNQVILNMVINASHAIADVVGDGSNGKGKITISTTLVNENWAEVRIADTGGGIPVEAQNHIFNPFFTTKGVGKGTGQGLAISHTVVVEKHKGRLNFETESGKGTTFIIQLPLNSETELSTEGRTQ